MNTVVVLAILLIAAILETAGDALVRAGLHTPGPLRYACLAAGAILLFAYAYAVNAPEWNFGKLLGIYVVLFFLMAQVIAWAAFGQRPSVGILVGGALIAAGGVVVSVWGK